MRLFTVTEACRELQMSERKLRQLISQRRIAVVRDGRWVRLDESAIQEYLQSRRLPALKAVPDLLSAPPDQLALLELAKKHGLE